MPVEAERIAVLEEPVEQPVPRLIRIEDLAACPNELHDLYVAERIVESEQYDAGQRTSQADPRGHCGEDVASPQRPPDQEWHQRRLDQENQSEQDTGGPLAAGQPGNDQPGEHRID